jgi:GTPase SAR1 family protein
MIIQALEDYTSVDKPGYAVLVKGSWGCGKTYLISEWIKDLDSESISKPVYVTLYGLTSTRQIDEAVLREISPWLHGDLAKKVGRWAKTIASATLRYNLDLNNDETDAEVICKIDPKMLLGDESEPVKTKRLLVFDDFERSKMLKKEVLGYINYYVEHLGCHVVVVGDEKKVDDNDYLEIKEKTIGKEFMVRPEMAQALDSFIKIADSNNAFELNSRKQLILQCFVTAGKDNLRVLRQSIEDYCMLVKRLPQKITSSGTFGKISQNLLGNFVATYAEYKSGDVKFEEFTKTLVKEVVSINNEGELTLPKNFQPMHALMEKYDRYSLFEKYRVMDSKYVEFVMHYLLSGGIDMEFLQTEVDRDLKTPWEKLGMYLTLENSDLKKCIGETAAHLETSDFEKMDFMIMASCNMMLAIHKGLTYDYSADKIIGWCKEGLARKFFKNSTSYDELYRRREHAYRCMNYYGGENAKEELQQLTKGIEAVFASMASNLKNALALLFESLTDCSLKQLMATYGSSLPDHSVSYSQSPIFAQVDADKFATSFVELKNESKNQVVMLVSAHYHEALDIPNPESFIHYYQDDLKNLPAIIEKLNEKKEYCQLVDRENVVRLIECLERALQKMKELLSDKSKKYDE